MEALWLVLTGILAALLAVVTAWVLDARQRLVIHELMLEVRQLDKRWDQAAEEVAVKAYDRARKRIDKAPLPAPEAGEGGAGDRGNGGRRPSPAEIMAAWRARR